jgi:hypothetical protein
MSSDARLFDSAGICSTAKRVEVEVDLLFCAALAIMVKCFEMNRLDQGIRHFILSKGENLEDFR